MPSEPLSVNTRGLPCPLPVIPSRRALEGMPTGAILEVLCGDAISACDVEVWATHHGYRVMTWDTQDAALRLTIGRQSITQDFNPSTDTREKRTFFE